MLRVYSIASGFAVDSGHRCPDAHDPIQLYKDQALIDLSPLFIIHKLSASSVYYMKATFVELASFARYRAEYLTDEQFNDFQDKLLRSPEAGDVISGSGGLRKIRYSDKRRHKGARGGLRVIYYWWNGGHQFWLFTIYDKDEADDLTHDQLKILKTLLMKELEQRGG